ncbi:hypothetical protein M2904_06990 [Vagococcus lutrae]|uniref:hypothetical protein n=1 Tax=Vagococcus lutrae TaxID=81947 RepID=UPI00200EC915|nr:hypothetical protein [Vagococcus lutrae]UQF37867.1 hypothetical protein M2904_06990 [Vagococcus lutrae]
MEWWQSMLISIIPATISGLITYLSATKKSEVEIEKSKIEYEKEITAIKEKSKADREKIELEFELKLQEMDRNVAHDKENRNDTAVTHLVEKLFSGEVKIDKLIELNEQAEKLKHLGQKRKI